MNYRWRAHVRVGLALLAFIAVAIAAYLFWPEPTLPSPRLEALEASVERGEYLATIGNCATCHTRKDGAPYAGGVKFHSDFGVLYSTNITSDQHSGIGQWSFADFYAAMKRGVRPDGTHLYPAFPYASFAKLTDADIASLYLYMRTIAPVRASTPPNALHFPYNLRFALRAWNKLFHSPDAYVNNPHESARWNRGAYLVQGIAHCGACHTPRNALGAEREAFALTGGAIVDAVSPGKYRRWSAVNLTPAHTGLATWSAQDIVAYLKTGESEHGIVHGPMTEVVMNSTRYLHEDDALAVATYLKGIPANTQGPSRPANGEQLAAGKIAYTVHCGSCHLPTGTGDKGLGVTLAGNAVAQASDPASFVNVILYGPHLPPPPFVSDRTRMKPFGKRLSDEDIANLSTYVRASFGNRGSPIHPAQVQRQR